MFLPSTEKELRKFGWHRPDVILVSGDSYIDSSFCGIAVIGRVLANAGFKTAVIAQPDINSGKDITRLGEPLLFWGVSGGCVDSMVANYTATKKRRQKDDYTPGGLNTRRPDRAVIRYTNLIRQHYKKTVPVVLGGIEASLRRIAHYDYWSNNVRRSVLFDAKADYLIYGMGEKAILELAFALKNQKPVTGIKGMGYIATSPPEGHIPLPPYETVRSDKSAFIKMFDTFYKNNDPLTAKGLFQQHGNRFLIQNPPAEYLSRDDLDKIYESDYERDLHPYYKKEGTVRALDTIRYSMTTHRGCYGECNFCAIAVHQGRRVRCRSEESVIREAEKLAKAPGFKGTITDAGGPTANMYGFECKRKSEHGSCRSRRCLYPEICKELRPDHSALISLLKKLRQIKGVKNVFTASGVRYDLISADRRNGEKYLKQIMTSHISGQMKIAPEHTGPNILKLMGKPGSEELIRFKKLFDSIANRMDKKLFLTYYLIAAHPGCGTGDMKALKKFCREALKTTPEQIQIFTPTPSTWSTLMYYTGTDPFSGRKIHIERDRKKCEYQKDIVTGGKARPEKKRTKSGKPGNKKARHLIKDRQN